MVPHMTESKTTTGKENGENLTGSKNVLNSSTYATLSRRAFAQMAAFVIVVPAVVRFKFPAVFRSKRASKGQKYIRPEAIIDGVRCRLYDSYYAQPGGCYGPPIWVEIGGRGRLMRIVDSVTQTPGEKRNG